MKGEGAPTIGLSDAAGRAEVAKLITFFREHMSLGWEGDQHGWTPAEAAIQFMSRKDATIASLRGEAAELKERCDALSSNYDDALIGRRNASARANRECERADAAEARALAAEQKVERYEEALQKIADSHIPDQPAAAFGDELSWAQRHVGTLRRIALDALTDRSMEDE